VINVHRLRDFKSIWRVIVTAFWARRSGFEIAHIFFNDSAMIFPLFLKIAGLKVIVSRRDLGFWYTSRNLSVLRFVARFVDRVVANCLAVRQKVIEAERFRPEKVEVIYNAIDRPESGQNRVSREQFEIPVASPLIIVVANLRPLKRIDSVIRSLPNVMSATRGAAHLLVVGGDRPGVSGLSHRAELERIAAIHGVIDRVHFAGQMVDPSNAIRLADVCVLCSETEGLSNTIIEYMLAGKPIVCSDVGGNAELIIDGVCGRVLPDAQVAGLSAALSEIVNRSAIGPSWGDAARCRAIELFTPASRLAEQYSGLYESIASTSSVAH
jgi:glycosyltransferase involved in cell wall biosynthesis